jgi:hypothetical protein
VRGERRVGADRHLSLFMPRHSSVFLDKGGVQLSVAGA